MSTHDEIAALRLQASEELCKRLQVEEQLRAAEDERSTAEELATMREQELTRAQHQLWVVKAELHDEQLRAATLKADRDDRLAELDRLRVKLRPLVALAAEVLDPESEHIDTQIALDMAVALQELDEPGGTYAELDRVREQVPIRRLIVKRRGLLSPRVAEELRKLHDEL